MGGVTLTSTYLDMSLCSEHHSGQGVWPAPAPAQSHTLSALCSEERHQRMRLQRWLVVRSLTPCLCRPTCRTPYREQNGRQLRKKVAVRLIIIKQQELLELD